MTKYLMTSPRSFTTRLDLHGLRNAMERHGLRYSELTAHVADVDAGHTVTADDGTTFTVATEQVQAQHLQVGDVLTNGGPGYWNTVTGAPRHLGGTGLVGFNLAREGREPWDGRLRADATCTILARQA